MNDQERVAFREQGYLVLPGLLSVPTIEHAMAIFAEHVEHARQLTANQGHYSLEKRPDGTRLTGLLHKVQGVGEVDARVLDIVRSPTIAPYIRDLVGADADAFGTKFFPKLAKGGTSTHWHQDNYYFGTETAHIVSCAIYYEPCDRDNGCLRVVPGSHQGGEIAEHVDDETTDGRRVVVDEGQAVDVVCPAGTVVLFSANLLHGTYDNTSDRTRFSTAWHYLPADLPIERFPDTHAADRHAVLRHGELIDARDR